MEKPAIMAIKRAATTIVGSIKKAINAAPHQKRDAQSPSYHTRFKRSAALRKVSSSLAKVKRIRPVSFSFV